ncbi:MAG: DUF1549 and DUF1553 domain-containing protein [Gemmataceae bacterium]|nr:DUF1549 and DUF1553 domain-containing protein [Gemmataceae bacterium]MDW8264703.1 DUF1549 domain-containing protein [Gemmataceae bacterium]
MCGTQRRILLGLPVVAALMATPWLWGDAPTVEREGVTPLSNAPWEGLPDQPLSPAEVDRLIADGLKSSGRTAAPLTTDEQFLRRVMLDLTGELPMPADIKEFVADADPQKRAKLIERLLASEEYARHWARYWKDVIAARVVEGRVLAVARGFEDWMRRQLQANRPWNEIVQEMLTAGGLMRFDDPAANGAAFFLLARQGPDAVNERAAETSRVFLGIQIQCAQCHDHPSDQWKRIQFHELAGYFARTRERLVLDGMRFVGMELMSTPFGEHRMPSPDDPNSGIVTHPRFLTGQGPRKYLPDEDRRQALAEAVVDRKNYWFAAAYVNRVWGELMGRAFYEPVDDMGPLKEAVFPEVLARLAVSFRATGYDTKALFRTILNTQTYQRQSRLGESADDHLHFAASYPTRLRADAIWQSLVNVLGTLSGPGGAARGPFPFANSRSMLEAQVKGLFEVDPSTKPDEVEGSVSQALLMMNNPVLNQRIRAEGTNLLARILSAYPNDDDAIRMVYLRTLARKPTDRELEKCRAYVKKVGQRAEAFEDILWALLNSTEFQTKR